MGEAARPSDAMGALQALHARGAQRIDPVRCRVIESLLKRAEAHEGLARQVLHEKVSKLLQALDEAVALAQARHQATVQGDREDEVPRPGALADLVAHLSLHKPAAAHDPLAAGLPAAGASSTPSKRASPVDPATVQFFRRTWSRLSADQRLAQSRSSLPENAGPLNSQHLVHRSLKVMRELSPEYFDLFIAHVDALLYLERSNEQAAREVGLPARPKGGRKSVGARRG